MRFTSKRRWSPRPMCRSPGHYEEWLLACKGGPKPVSNFDYAGPLTEIVLLGVLALRAQANGWSGTAPTSKSRTHLSSINTSIPTTATAGHCNQPKEVTTNLTNPTNENKINKYISVVRLSYS